MKKLGNREFRSDRAGVEAKSFVSENPEEWKMCKSFVSMG
jgi:hypothetical protein